MLSESVYSCQRLNLFAISYTLLCMISYYVWYLTIDASDQMQNSQIQNIANNGCWGSGDWSTRFDFSLEIAFLAIAAELAFTAQLWIINLSQMIKTHWHLLMSLPFFYGWILLTINQSASLSDDKNISTSTDQSPSFDWRSMGWQKKSFKWKWCSPKSICFKWKWKWY